MNDAIILLKPLLYQY